MSAGTRAVCSSAGEKIEGRVGSVRLRRENYVPGSGEASDLLTFDVGVACGRGAARLDLSWDGKHCDTLFLVGQTDLVELDALVGRVRLCTEHREAAATVPPLLIESAVQFSRDCLGDPSFPPVSGDVNVNVYRYREWPYSDSRDVFVFAGGQAPLMAKLTSLAEPHVSDRCPANWREAFFAP